MRLGPTELVIILIIVMLLFGAKRLPDLASSIGTSMKEFRKATKDALEEDDAEGEASEEPADRSSDPDTDAGR